MSWLHLDSDQGKIVESICKEHWTGPNGKGCKSCPLISACRADLSSIESDAERAAVFEKKMWDLAKAVETNYTILLTKSPSHFEITANGTRIISGESVHWLNEITIGDILKKYETGIFPHTFYD